MKSKSTLRNFLAFAGSSLLAVTSASAADLTWDITPGTVGVGDGTITGGTGNWNTTNGNWTADGGANNVAWTNGDNAFIIGGATMTIDVPITAGTLTFTSGGVAGRTLSGSEITINNGMYLERLSSLTWNAPIKLGGSQTWTHNQINANSTGKSMAGGTDLNGHTLTWDMTNVQSNNRITHSNLTGTGSIIKDGTGWLGLGGTNTYTGSNTINAGTIDATSSTALGDANNPLTINTGGTLNMSGNLSIGNLTGTGGVITSTATSGTRTLTIGSGDGSGGNFQGVIENGSGGTTALTKTGAGTISLSGVNSYIGGTTVAGGTLSLGTGTNNSNLADLAPVFVDGGAKLNLNFSSGNPDTVLHLSLGGTSLPAGQYGHSNSGVTNGGAGVGAYDAFFEANTGIIDNFGGSTAPLGLVFWDGGTVDIAVDGDAVSAGGNGTWNTTIQNWDIGFTGHVNWDNANNDTAILGGANGTVTLGEPITVGGLQIDNRNIDIVNSTLTFGVTGVINSTSVGNQNDPPIISSKISGAAITKTGPGYIQLTNNDNDFASFTLSEGTLGQLPAGTYTGIGTGLFTINGGGLFVENNNPTTIDNNMVWNGNWFSQNVSNSSKTTTWNGDVSLGADITVSSKHAQVFNGDISETGGVRKLTLTNSTGSSTITLAGNNSFSGGVQINQGTLNINSATALGTGTFTVNISGAVIDNTSGNPVTLSTNNVQEWNQNFTFTGSNALNLGTGAVTINANRTVTVSANTLTVGGAIGETGGTRTLAKAGNGTLVLGGANTYAGNTTVSAGTLALVDGSQNSAITVNSGATLDFTLGSSITSTKALTLSAGHSVTVTGTPALASYTLMTADGGINGTPNLNPAITGYELVVDGNDLKLNSTGAASPYDTWSGGAAFGDDANGDGVDNGLAFLLGAANPNVSALNKLPTVTESAGGLVLTFQMLNDTANGDATLAIEHSNSLANGSWTAVQVPYSSGTVGDIGFNITGTGPLNVTATIPVSKAAGGKLFGRLKAENP